MIIIYVLYIIHEGLHLINRVTCNFIAADIKNNNSTLNFEF